MCLSVVQQLYDTDYKTQKMKKKNRKENFSLVLNWLLTAIKFRIIQQRRYYEATELLRIFSASTNEESLTKMGFTKSLNKCASMNVTCPKQKVKFYKIEVKVRKFEYIILNETDYKNLDNIRINPRRKAHNPDDTKHQKPTPTLPIVSPEKSKPSPTPSDIPTDITHTTDENRTVNTSQLSEVLKGHKKLDSPMALSFLLGKERAKKNC